MRKIFRQGYLSGLFSIAFDSLLRHRLRSLLSILGIICGVAAVFATLSVGEGAKREVLAGIRQLGLDNVIFRRSIPSGRQVGEGVKFSEGLQQKDSVRLLALSDIVADVGYLKAIPVGLSGLGTRVIPLVAAVSSSYLDVFDLKIQYGRRILPEDESRTQLVCLIGEAIYKQLGPAASVGEYLRIGEQMFRIVGVIRLGYKPHLKQKGALVARDLNQMVLIPYGSHEYLSRAREDRGVRPVDEIIVRLKKNTGSEQLVSVLHRTIDIAHHNIRDYQTIVPRRLLQQAKETQRIFNLVLAAIGGISLVVGGIGIMNVMLASVSERTREIGIRRAVGATTEDIMYQFLAEAIVLTTIGGVFGVCAGIICSWAIATFAGWTVAVTLYAVLISLFTAITVGLCSGVYPALKAGRMDPVTALSTP